MKVIQSSYPGPDGSLSLRGLHGVAGVGEILRQHWESAGTAHAVLISAIPGRRDPLNHAV